MGNILDLGTRNDPRASGYQYALPLVGRLRAQPGPCTSGSPPGGPRTYNPLATHPCCNYVSVQRYPADGSSFITGEYCTGGPRIVRGPVSLT
ncbi:hypothetical protein [Amycolatopsis pigmentata]|uniref:Uncharacterized protein n=1 Tax=Amycolatopsis pigmentata TaxID=450801 RepID=A0ABW5FNN7_9PSEU